MSKLRQQAVSAASNRKPIEVEKPRIKTSEYYGEKVFNRKAMTKYLSKETYSIISKVIDKGETIDRGIA